VKSTCVSAWIARQYMWNVANRNFRDESKKTENKASYYEK